MEFDWYVPGVDPMSPGGAIQMVCNGGMQGKDEVDVRTHDDKFCRSTQNYMGPSDAGTCVYAGDPSCVSPGADLTVGALHITLKRLDELDWSPPYVGVRQIVVRPPTPFDPLSGILHIFQPFTSQVGPSDAISTPSPCRALALQPILQDGPAFSACTLRSTWKIAPPGTLCAQLYCTALTVRHAV